MVYSDTLKLADLEKSFSNTLNSYNMAYDAYLDYLNTISKKNINVARDFIPAQGLTNISDSILDTKSSFSSGACKDYCVANAACKGATFISSKRSCILNKSDKLSLTNSKDQNDTAIVPKIVYYVYNLDILNNRLIELNTQIKAETNKLSPYKSEVDLDVIKKSANLDSIYKQLVNNREDLEKKRKFYSSLEQEKNDSSLALKRNLSLYTIYVLVFIVILVISLVVMSKMSSTTQYGGGPKDMYMTIIIFIFFSIFFLTGYLQTNVNYYIVWGVLVLIFVYYMMKLRRN